METLELKKQTANTDVSKAHFVRLADLINYEGPLLVLYKQKYTSNIYLLRWVDADETYNRWILYQTDIANVLAFINRKISHKFLFEAYSDICYAIDIDTNMNWVNVGEISKTMLPYDYIPIEDDFFDIEDCPN